MPNYFGTPYLGLGLGDLDVRRGYPNLQDNFGRAGGKIRTPLLLAEPEHGVVVNPQSCYNRIDIPLAVHLIGCFDPVLLAA